MYTKDQPYLATILERRRLTPESCTKETYHIVLDISGSGMKYGVGDCIGVMPNNSLDQVEEMLARWKLAPDMVVEHRGDQLRAEDFFRYRANLMREPKELAKWPPLLPRFYSIASSQVAVGDQIHLTVKRTGICTTLLCELADVGGQVPIFHHAADHFVLPDGDSPIIMIGPGTGVAPYRGFLQERRATGASGENWLFFGEWTRDGHFFYEEDWRGYERLKMSLAFSRDGEKKVYVQDRVREEGEELRRWIERGAYIYVCGDARGMAPAVDQALAEIVGKEALRQMRREKRYQRDVY